MITFTVNKDLGNGVSRVVAGHFATEQVAIERMDEFNEPDLFISGWNIPDSIPETSVPDTYTLEDAIRDGYLTRAEC